VENVYSAVRTESLYKTDTPSLERVNMVHKMSSVPPTTDRPLLLSELCAFRVTNRILKVVYVNSVSKLQINEFMLRSMH
jgi:hypothetical protein